MHYFSEGWGWWDFLFLKVVSVRVLLLRSGGIHGFCDRALTLPSCHVICEHAASRVLEPCTLSSACLVSCWSMVFRSRPSCLEFRFRVGDRTIVLHVLSLCGSVQSRVRSAACSSVPMHCVCVARSSCFYRVRAFMLCLVLCGLQLVFFIGCVLLCCHVFCEHMACEYFH